MARGTPDWTKSIGKQVLPIQDKRDEQVSEVVGADLNVISGRESFTTFTASPLFHEYIYKILTVSAEDDSAIHRVRVQRFFEGITKTSAYFKKKLVLIFSDFIGDDSDPVIVQVRNNSAGTVNFRLTMTRIRRKEIT